MHSPSATSPTGGAEARRVVTQPALHDDLMERIVDRANMRRAWKRVKANKGVPGSDGMTLEDFPTFARRPRQGTGTAWIPVCQVCR